MTIIITCILLASLGKDYISYINISRDIPLKFPESHWALVNKIIEIKKTKELNVYLDDGVMFQALRYQARLYDMGGISCEAWRADWDEESKILSFEDFFNECAINRDINAIIVLPHGQLHNYIRNDKSLIKSFLRSNKSIYSVSIRFT